MLSSKLRSDIRRLWDRFWSGGIANPLTAIEQITYLVFLKRLEDLDNQRAQAAREANRTYKSIYDVPDGETYKWSYIKQLPAADNQQLNHVQGPVFEWMRNLEGAEERMRDAVFVIPSANLLRGAIEIIDQIFVPARNQDTLGDIYEMLLSEIAEAGKNGQFRTPRHIIRTICDLVDPRYADRICDPACGTGGFLINAYQHILKSNTDPEFLAFEADGTPLYTYGDRLTPDEHERLRQNHFYGWDFDRTMVRLGWMNLIQHGLENPQIHYADTLGSRFNSRLDPGTGDLVESFNVVMANPPFTGSIDKNDIGESLRDLNTTKTELLFVELILQLLATGGRAGVIVPEGLLFGSTRAHKALRHKLVAENQLNAVISLPGGVFQPYTGVKTSILLFTKGGESDVVWFYEVGADGLSLNAKRTEHYSDNDLWDLTLKYRLRHANAGVFPQPTPAFVDGDTWRAWQNMEAETRRVHYLQPQIVDEKQPDPEEPDQTMTVPMLAKLETAERDAAQDWTASADELAQNDHNLSAGRYKPFTLEAVDHDPPAQIIRELQEMEVAIQDGLEDLLAMVEGVE